MKRLKETIRDPKWIAVGFTVLVLLGSAAKFLTSLSDNPDAEKRKNKSAVVTRQAEDVAPGSYEILSASWIVESETASAAAAGSSGNEPDPALDDIAPLSGDEAFYKKAHKIWSGICISVEGK